MSQSLRLLSNSLTGFLVCSGQPVGGTPIYTNNIFNFSSGPTGCLNLVQKSFNQETVACRPKTRQTVRGLVVSNILTFKLQSVFQQMKLCLFRYRS